MHTFRLAMVAIVMTLGLAASTHAQTPAAVTATCKDGTSWVGTHRSGACRGHKGVQTFTTPPASATTAPAAVAAIPSPAPAAPAAPPPAAATTAPAGGGAGQVWLNTSSKVYHCQGDRDYGHTKAGAYMTEAAAKAAGARPSRGKACS